MTFYGTPATSAAWIVPKKYQAVEVDSRRREALLHKIQQLMYERAMFAPIVEQAALTG